ncbi:MAG: Fe-S protein assembly co-chaperone HscB [Polyangiales bacterium]
MWTLVPGLTASVLPVMVLDPFAALGLPRRFAFDRAQVEARHRELSKALHPDKYVNAPGNERRLALSKAVAVNEAWRVVRDPVKRAEALLASAGLGGEVGETREPMPSPDFLMEVMEAREQLEEASDAKDLSTLTKVIEAATTQQQTIEAELGAALDSALARGDAAALRAAIPLLGRLRYAARFLDEARAIEDRLAGL